MPLRPTEKSASVFLEIETGVLGRQGRQPMWWVAPINVVSAVRTLGHLAGLGVIEIDTKTAFAVDATEMFGGVS